MKNTNGMEFIKVLGDKRVVLIALRLHARDRKHFKRLIMAYTRIIEKCNEMHDISYLPGDYYFESWDNDFITIFDAIGYSDKAKVIDKELEEIASAASAMKK
jgi:hypothetical protein